MITNKLKQVWALPLVLAPVALPLLSTVGLSLLEGFFALLGHYVTVTRKDCVPDSLDACWYFTPRRLALEFLCIVPPCLGLSVWLLRKWQNRESAQESDERSELPKWLNVIVIFHFCTLVMYKLAAPGKWAFMLMPCNISSTLWFIAAVCESDHLRVQMYQHIVTLQGPTLIVLSPVFSKLCGIGLGIQADTTGLDLPLEIEFFWFSHTLLIFLGMFVIWSKRVDVNDYGWTIHFATVLFGISFYFGFVTMLALFVNKNLNYMLHPPRTPACPLGKFFAGLQEFHDNYRLVYVFAISMVCLIARLFAKFVQFLCSHSIWVAILKLGAMMFLIPAHWAAIPVARSFAALPESYGLYSGMCDAYDLPPPLCRSIYTVNAKTLVHSPFCSSQEGCYELVRGMPPVLAKLLWASLTALLSRLMYLIFFGSKRVLFSGRIDESANSEDESGKSEDSSVWSEFVSFLSKNRGPMYMVFWIPIAHGMLWGFLSVLFSRTTYSVLYQSGWSRLCRFSNKHWRVIYTLMYFSLIQVVFWSERRVSGAISMTLPQNFARHKAKLGHFGDLMDLLDEFPQLWTSRSALGDSLLHWSVLTGNIAFSEQAIAEGVDVDTEFHNKQTPLSWASTNGHLAAVSMLVKHGANMRHKDSMGATPLTLAVQKGHSDLVRFLVDKGGPELLTDGDINGCTALHWAAFKGDLKNLQLLEDLGSDLEATDSFGMTPLHRAAVSQTEVSSVLEYLVTKTSNPLQLDFKGRTPLDLAESNTAVYMKLGHLLVEHLGDPELSKEFEETANLTMKAEEQAKKLSNQNPPSDKQFFQKGELGGDKVIVELEEKSPNESEVARKELEELTKEFEKTAEEYKKAR